MLVSAAVLTPAGCIHIVIGVGVEQWRGWTTCVPGSALGVCLITSQRRLMQ
mgnify:CR=1 FL=1